MSEMEGTEGTTGTDGTTVTAEDCIAAAKELAALKERGVRVSDGVCLANLGPAALLVRHPGIKPGGERFLKIGKGEDRVLDDGNVLPFEADVGELGRVARAAAFAARNALEEARENFDESKLSRDFDYDEECPCCGERIIREGRYDQAMTYSDWLAQQEPHWSEHDFGVPVEVRARDKTKEYLYSAVLLGALFDVARRLGEVRRIGILRHSSDGVIVLVADIWRSALMPFKDFAEISSDLERWGDGKAVVATEVWPPAEEKAGAEKEGAREE